MALTRALENVGENHDISFEAGADPGGSIEAIAPLKTYESNFIHQDFVQFEKQHSRHKSIFPFIVLSEQCSEVQILRLSYSSEPALNLTTKYYWMSPLTLPAGTAPVSKHLSHSKWLAILTCYISGVFVCNLWFLLIVRVNVVSCRVSL